MDPIQAVATILNALLKHDCSDEKPYWIAQIFTALADRNELEGVLLDDLNDGPDYEGYEDSEFGRQAARSAHESDLAWHEFGKDCRRIATYLKKDPRFSI